jgi:GT2 family glycosyltransferase
MGTIFEGGDMDGMTGGFSPSRAEAEAAAPALTVAAIIATLGRPSEVGDLLDRLDRQTVRPRRIIISAVSDADLPPRARERAEVILGSKGLPAQRNRGMAPALEDCDLIAFFDDDYVPSVRCIEGVARAFAERPGLVGASGRLLADGAQGPGVGLAEADAMLAEFDAAPPAPDTVIRRSPRLYGCNMVYRASAIGDLRFDETLPLYAWQEDTDFAAGMIGRGELAFVSHFTGVHRGVKGGRTSGRKLGYSQVANPLYLHRKGRVPFSYAAMLISKNFLANHAKLLFPEPWMDRAGRARGNWAGIADALRGRVTPGRMLDF